MNKILEGGLSYFLKYFWIQILYTLFMACLAALIGITTYTSYWNIVEPSSDNSSWFNTVDIDFNPHVSHGDLNEIVSFINTHEGSTHVNLLFEDDVVRFFVGNVDIEPSVLYLCTSNPDLTSLDASLNIVYTTAQNECHRDYLEPELIDGYNPIGYMLLEPNAFLEVLDKEGRDYVSVSKYLIENMIIENEINNEAFTSLKQNFENHGMGLYYRQSRSVITGDRLLKYEIIPMVSLLMVVAVSTLFFSIAALVKRSPHKNNKYQMSFMLLISCLLAIAIQYGLSGFYFDAFTIFGTFMMVLIYGVVILMGLGLQKS